MNSYNSKNNIIKYRVLDSIFISITKNQNTNKIPLLDKEIDNNEDEEFQKNDKINLNKDKKEKDETIYLSDVFLKLLYGNMDKITLVAMYFISMHTINIIHFFNIVIFMVQILKINFTKKHSKLIIILLQILFLFEYIVDITKNYFQTVFNDNFKLFQFLLSVTEENDKYKININIEIFCYVAIHTFYFQNKLFK